MNELRGRYRIFGGPSSPYSHKMLALMRYRRIPHEVGGVRITGFGRARFCHGLVGACIRCGARKPTH